VNVVVRSAAITQVATCATVFSTEALSRLSRVRDNKDYPEDSVIPSLEPMAGVSRGMVAVSSG
jgi:hypothetical protein